MAVCLCVSLHAGSWAPIPQTVWDMKEDPAQGIKGAVVLERRMTLTGMVIQHRVRVRVLSEAGRAAVAFLGLTPESCELEGRTVQRDGSVVLYDTVGDICTPQGAVWVTVPASATIPERLELELTGTVSEGGAVRAKVRLRETGNATGLRSSRLLAGLAALEPLLLSQGFRLPPAGRLSELASSDPLDLDHPFEVTFVLEHPNGATPRGTSLVLVGWGLPPAPGIIQKPFIR